jgi:sortase A
VTAEVADAPSLARGFAAALYAEAVARAANGDAGRLPPSLDWDAVWAEASLGSPEEAVGRAIIAVDRLAGVLDADRQGQAGSRHPLPTAPPASRDAIDETAPPTLLLVPPPAAPAPPPLPPAPTLAPPVPSPEAARRREQAVARPRGEPALERLRRRIALGPEPVSANRGWYALFTWVMYVGALVILFAGWTVWGTSIVHSHAQRALRAQFTAHVHEQPKVPTLVAATAVLPQPAEGSVVARLQVPAIGIDQFVVEGTAEADLAKGPGHYVGTALPGQQGNVAIAGHRTTYGAPFNHLDELKVGDSVLLTTGAGEQLRYVVSAAPVAVSPRDVGVLNDAGDNRITLTTCNPKFSASQRLVVVAVLQTPVPVPAHHPRGHEHVRNGFVGWNLGYLAGALALVAALVALAVLRGRIATHLGPARWLVLAPLWAAGIFFLFVQLRGLLPAYF